MTQEELLWKIWDKVEYLNHKSTQMETDIIWIKWLLMLVVAAILVQAIRMGWKFIRNNGK